MKDLTGKRFGRLVVTEFSGRSPTGYYLWKCRCDCGRETIVSRNNLTNRHTLSCGCLQKECTRKACFIKHMVSARLVCIVFGAT